ncbi:MAG: dihydrodipicolinate synthase family protein [Saprospiraceae bacterium]|nr:dihydrodipicolinate synthase family protein [Saprospiraceae bacterium]MBK8853449.1 dihydrodipicolinate synthase family protein [Saprospiraceae bacterium]
MNWTGVFPAVTTKFTNSDELDLTAFSKNITAQKEAGVHGIILGGTLGEASTLSTSEKEVLVKSSIETMEGSIPVILNIAEGSLKEAIHQVNLAKSWGVSGLMVLPPMRYFSDQRETVHYFSSIAQSTDLPIMIYNNPVDYKIEVTLKMFEELQVHQNIQAVKESTRDISNITRMINQFGDRFKILCGVDTLALESLFMGAHGWVAGLVCAFPKETMAIYQLAKQGKTREAIQIYRWFLPLLELDIHPKLVQYIKLAEQLEGIGTEFVRAPRLTLIGEEREKIIGIIQKAQKTRPVLS